MSKLEFNKVDHWDNWKVSGIPCVYVIKNLEVCSDCIEFDVQLFDRNGYRAHWLESKMTPEEEDHIRDIFAEYWYAQDECG